MLLGYILGVEIEDSTKYHTIYGSLKFQTTRMSEWITPKHAAMVLPGKFALAASPFQ
jgi:hypothetical protein